MEQQDGTHPGSAIADNSNLDNSINMYILNHKIREETMKKIICIVIAAIVLSCDSGIEINMDCVLKHTAEVVTLESINGTTHKIFVNLSWTWLWDRPGGDGVIIERRIDANYDSIAYVSPIETLMTFTDTAAVLQPGVEVYYKMSLLSGKAVDSFCTTNFTIPPAQHFFQPDTEFIGADSTLMITFGDLAGYTETDVALYQTPLNNMDTLLARPIDQLLNMLINPVFDTTISDTSITVNTGSLDTLNVYLIRLSSSSMSNLDYITDTSIGLRAFVRRP